jgi:hypothetical protein
VAVYGDIEGGEAVIDSTVSSYEGFKQGNYIQGVAGAGNAFIAAVSTIDGVRQIQGELRNCFPAGTPVHTLEGIRPIESVRVGDEVWAYDLTTSSWQPRHVLQVFHRTYEGTSVFVGVAGEAVEATALHPFWVQRGEALSERPMREHLSSVPDDATTAGRWVDACDLRVGDELLLREGRQAVVSSLRRQPYDALVYNFEVADLHCYAVGNCGALVHNWNGGLEGTAKNGETVATARGRAAHKAKDYGPGYEKEVTLPNGKRADAVNLEKADVVELKPNNPRAVRRGERQVEGYRQQLEAEYDKPFTGRVETYDP